MPNRVQVVVQPKRGKELALAARRRQNEENQQQEESDQGSVPSESEDERSFLPKVHQKLKKRKSQTKRHRATDSDEEEDDSRAYKPLSDSFHHNRQLQRYDNHPTMANGRTRRSGKDKNASKSTSKASKSDSTEDETTKENLELKLVRMQKRIKLASGASMKTLTNGTLTAMEREVSKCTKTQLWKVCKFFKDEARLEKGATFVMKMLDLQELAGLKGSDLVEAEEEWKATYKGEIRRAMNKQRNYVQQELRTLIEEAFKDNREAEYPDEEQMLDLVLRNKLDDDTDEEERAVYEKLFDKYWNELLPKVAGHGSWGPGKRHHELISYGKEMPDDPDLVCYVSPSDEAFVAVLWLNCFKKWKHRALFLRANPGQNVNEEDEEMQTPYTNAKAGQKKFGGWNAKGIRKYLELLEQIKQNRNQNKPYIEAVESAALTRIRKAEKIEEKEKNRKSKKRKAAEKGEFDDETDDENDFGSW